MPGESAPGADRDGDRGDEDETTEVGVSELLDVMEASIEQTGDFSDVITQRMELLDLRIAHLEAELEAAGHAGADRDESAGGDAADVADAMGGYDHDRPSRGFQ